MSDVLRVAATARRLLGCESRVALELAGVEVRPDLFGCWLLEFPNGHRTLVSPEQVELWLAGRASNLTEDRAPG